MDSRHYSQSFAYVQEVRPEYPTPPPSFSNHPATPVELVQYGTYSLANGTGYIQIPTPQVRMAVWLNSYSLTVHFEGIGFSSK